MYLYGCITDSEWMVNSPLYAVVLTYDKYFLIHCVAVAKQCDERTNRKRGRVHQWIISVSPSHLRHLGVTHTPGEIRRDLLQS